MRRLRLPGGDLEYAVLAKLWELGVASAGEIHAGVGEPLSSRGRNRQQLEP